MLQIIPSRPYPPGFMQEGHSVILGPLLQCTHPSLLEAGWMSCGVAEQPGPNGNSFERIIARWFRFHVLGAM